jgi:hypothetical protein
MAIAGGRPTAPLMLEPGERGYLERQARSPQGPVHVSAQPDHPALRRKHPEQGRRCRVGRARAHCLEAAPTFLKDRLEGLPDAARLGAHFPLQTRLPRRTDAAASVIDGALPRYSSMAVLREVLGPGLKS